MDKLAMAREVLSSIAMTSDEARTLDAILDRLTPAPGEAEPEVDEATKVTRRVRAAHYADESYLEPDDEEGFGSFLAVKNVLREVLAAKDAERDQYAGLYAERCGDLLKGQSELATLRAEIERLKADNARVQQLLAIQEGVSDAVHEALWEADKAAERNPAEGNDADCYRSGIDAVKRTPISLSNGSGTDTTGVEVQQVDCGLAQIYADCHSEDGSFNILCAERIAAESKRIRTEAEARGRREAFSRVKHVMFGFDGQLANAANCQRLIDELKRMMTEVK